MSDRNVAKRKRAAQNKAARQALASRRTRAAQSPSSAPEPEPTRGRLARSMSTRATPGSTSRPSRTTTTRPVRQPTSAIGRLLFELREIPGGQAVLFAFLFSLVAAGMVLFTQVTPRAVMEAPAQIVAEVREAEDLPVPDDLPEDPIVDTAYATEVVGPIAYVFAGIPVLITGSALLGARRATRRRSWMIASIAMGLFVYLLASLGIFYMFSLGALVYGWYKVRKAEGPRVRPGTADDVDEDEADEDDDDDEVDEGEEGRDDDEPVSRRARWGRGRR